MPEDQPNPTGDEPTSSKSNSYTIIIAPSSFRSLLWSIYIIEKHPIILSIAVTIAISLSIRSLIDIFYNKMAVVYSHTTRIILKPDSDPFAYWLTISIRIMVIVFAIEYYRGFVFYIKNKIKDRLD